VKKKALSEKAQKWDDGLSEPNYPTIEDAYTAAGLSEDEKEIFRKYSRYTSDWLQYGPRMIYSKIGGNCVIKMAAEQLLVLLSAKVSGQRDSFIKEMFGKKPYHITIENPNSGGIRIKPKSETFYDKLFELSLLNLFVKHAYTIELPRLQESKKIPEFTAINKESRICVEAKNLNVDNYLDKIFGNPHEMVIDKILSHQEIVTNLDGKQGNDILSQFKRNYSNAINKYKEIDPNYLYLIFIKVPFDLSLSGGPINKYIQTLPSDWQKQSYDRLLGLVLVESMNTQLIRNPTLKNHDIWEQVDFNELFRIK
jgi:hypothetical protein